MAGFFDYFNKPGTPYLEFGPTGGGTSPMASPIAQSALGPARPVGAGVLRPEYQQSSTGPDFLGMMEGAYRATKSPLGDLGQDFTPTYQTNPADQQYDQRRQQNIALGGSGNIPRSYSSPGNLADAITAASMKQRTGGSLQDAYALGGFNMDAGPLAPQNIIRRAQRGDSGAANQMADMFGGELFRKVLASNDPRALAQFAPMYQQANRDYWSAMSGGQLPWDAAAAEKAQARSDVDRARSTESQRYADDQSLKNRSLGLKERGVEAEIAGAVADRELKKAAQQVDADYKKRLATIEELRLTNAMTADERKHLEVAAQRVHEKEMLELQQKYQQGTPANQLAKVQLGKAELELQREKTGSLQPAQERVLGNEASMEADRLLNSGAVDSPEEARQRAAQAKGVDPAKVAVPSYSTGRAAVQASLDRLKMGSPEDAFRKAYDAALENEMPSAAWAGPMAPAAWIGKKIGKAAYKSADADPTEKQAAFMREYFQKKGVPEQYVGQVMRTGR